MSPAEARKQAIILNMTAEILINLAEENEALRALVSPPALLPIAPIPERQVTGINVDEDKE